MSKVHNWAYFSHSTLIQWSLYCPCRVFELLLAWGRNGFIKSHSWNARLTVTPGLFCFALWIFVAESLLWRMKEIRESVPCCSISNSHEFCCWWCLSNQDRTAVSGEAEMGYIQCRCKLLLLEVLWIFLPCHILCVCPFFSFYFSKMPLPNKQFASLFSQGFFILVLWIVILRWEVPVLLWLFFFLIDVFCRTFPKECLLIVQN